MVNNYKPYMNIRDTATVTGLSQHYLRDGCKTGAIPHMRIGTKIMINVPLLRRRLDSECLSGMDTTAWAGDDHEDD